MMGHRTKAFKFFAPTNLDALLPSDNFYRQLEEKLDLSFVRELVKGCYEEMGRPSVDPVVFFKLQLIAFFEGITSERRLMETAHLNLAHRWYLGYDLDEPLPDHSSLSKIRSRYGAEAFHRFFEHIVEICIEAGLVEGEELYLDATKVDANASVHNLRTRFSVMAAQEHVERVFAENPVPEEPEPQGLTEAPAVQLDPAPREPRASAEASEAEPKGQPSASPFISLVETYRHGYRSKLKTSRYTRTSDSLFSPADPDACLMKSATGTRARVGYHDHYVVDGGKARIILSALVTPASVMENSPMLDLVRQVRFRWRLRPRQATGDATYGTVENIKGLEDDGIRAFVSIRDFSGRTGYLPAKAFTYDAENDRYLCPQGQELPQRYHAYRDSTLIYQADAAVCNACPIRSRCTPSSKGRTISRSFFESYLDKVKGYRQLSAYERALRKRKVWLEPLFGEAKVLHGLRRFRLRGLHKVNMEGLMVAAGQNLKRLLKHWGARRWPALSALVAVLRFLARGPIPAPAPRYQPR
jgi:transposase